MLLYSLQFARNGQEPTGEMSHVLGQQNGGSLSALRGHQHKEKSPCICFYRMVQAVRSALSRLAPVVQVPTMHCHPEPLSAPQHSTGDLGMLRVLGQQDSGELGSRATTTLSPASCY